VEVPIYAVAPGVRLPTAFGASAITHPSLWSVLFPRLPLPYVWLIVAGEAFAIVVETAYFGLWFHRRRAWLWSLVVNGASFRAGMLSRWLFGMP
jgi:hypothetical protein